MEGITEQCLTTDGITPRQDKHNKSSNNHANTDNTSDKVLSSEAAVLNNTAPTTYAESINDKERNHLWTSACESEINSMKRLGVY